MVAGASSTTPATSVTGSVVGVGAAVVVVVVVVGAAVVVVVVVVGGVVVVVGAGGTLVTATAAVSLPVKPLSVAEAVNV